MSFLPTLPEFLAQFETDEELEDELPDWPISSLRDVQYLYGRIYTLATTGSGEYAAYLTPGEISDLVGEDESLIVVRIDCSGETPALATDERGPVWVTSYDEALANEVAFCEYDSARGIDHSVTHRSGRDSSPDKLARYATERLTRWATDDAVRAATESNDEGWIIEALASLGEDESAKETIESAVLDQLGGPRTALLTVQVKIDAEGAYHWPGELDVFNEAMRARKRSKLISKNEATESVGEATDLVTGVRGPTVGTAEDPLNYYLGKQVERFPGLDPDQAWRAHPVSEETAVTLISAGPFIEACTYPTFGATVYYLPYYPGQITVEQCKSLYRLLRTTLLGEENMTPVERAYERVDGDMDDPRVQELRFYVSAVRKHQAKRYDVYGDTLNGHLLHPVRLANRHDALTHSWVWNGSDVSVGDLRPPFVTHENWQLLSGQDLLPQIATGWYFGPTFAPADDDQEVSADDQRIRALVSVLSGEPLNVETLLGEYVERLIEEQDETFPDFHLSSQYLQLCALAAADLLRAEDVDARGRIAEAPSYTEETTMPASQPTVVADGGSQAVAREQKLATFIEQTPALENPQRRGSFLLGILVGQVGGYQRSAERRSTTVVDQYPIKAISATKIKRITQEVLDRDVVYSRENQMAGTMYAEVVDRLVETMAAADPDTWELSTDDLRFYYALGVSYGLNNWTKSTDTEGQA